MSVPLPAFRRVRLTQQCVIHPQDKGGNYLPCASEDWVLFVSLAADGEKIILRTEHLCLPIKPGGALLLPPNVCHELPFVQAPCLMLGFSAADDGQAVFEFPQLQGTPAWMFLLLLYSEQTTAAARTPLLEALLMQMAPMARGFELCAPDAAFSLATEVLQHLNLCFAEELSLTELTNRFHVSTSHMIHMFKAQFGLPPIQYMVRRRIGEAQHLLRTTEDSAGDIAGRVGMINRNYFYRMFKRLVGVSPVRYREVIGERPVCWLEETTLRDRAGPDGDLVYAARCHVGGARSRGCPLNTLVYVKRFGILTNFIWFITVTCTRHNPWFPVPIQFPWSK